MPRPLAAARPSRRASCSERGSVAFHRADGADHAGRFHAPFDARLASHAGGVDEDGRCPGEIDVRIDGVDGRPGPRVDDGPLGAGDAVEQGGFAGVRASEERDARDRLVARLFGLGGREVPDDRGLELVHATTMQRDDPVHAELVEQVRVMLLLIAVDLVGGEDRRAIALTEACDRHAIPFCGSRRSVEDAHDDVGFRDGGFHAPRDPHAERVVAHGVEAARIDERDVPASHVRVGVVPVASDALHVVDDGDGTTREAVEERALAHVGAADDGDEGFHERAPGVEGEGGSLSVSDVAGSPRPGSS
jgi:hypothetical protein